MRRKVRLFLLIPFIFVLPLAFFLSGNGEEITVYVTSTGNRYHRETCSSLRNSKRPLSLAEAAKAGYEPCGICKPSGLEAQGSGSAPREDSSLYRVNTAGLRSSAAAETGRMIRALVSDHVDGDTVKVRIAGPPPELRERETIRLIGVDTPETVHPNQPVQFFGKEASDFTKTRLLGKDVYLAFDWDLRDRYGRLLAYIYTEAGECFNAALVREGYGHAYTRFSFQFMEEFRVLEREAREAGRGLWGN